MLLYLYSDGRVPLISAAFDRLLIVGVYVSVAGGTASIKGPQTKVIQESVHVPMDNSGVLDSAHYWSWSIHERGDYVIQASPGSFILRVRTILGWTWIEVLGGGQGEIPKPLFNVSLANYDPKAVYPVDKPITYTSRWQQL